VFFTPDAVITGLWCHEAHCKKAKPQVVSGRDFHSLTFRLSGKVSISDGTHTLLSAPGCITYTPRGMTYVTEVMEDSTLIAVHFETLHPYPDQTLSVLHPTDQKKFLFLFSRMLEARRSGDGNNYLPLSIFYEILAELSKDAASVPIPKRIRLAKKHIDEHYREPLTVSALAEEAGLSETYFRTAFRAAFGISPNAYLKQVRLENATLLLRTGYCSVSEVASNCGFDSPSYFSYEFRRAMGMTPSEYIRSKR